MIKAGFYVVLDLNPSGALDDVRKAEVMGKFPTVAAAAQGIEEDILRYLSIEDADIKTLVEPDYGDPWSRPYVIAKVEIVVEPQITASISYDIKLKGLT